MSDKQDSSGSTVTVSRVGESRILVRFAGRVETDIANRAAQDLAQLLDQNPVELWFDVRNINSYPAGAREAWQRTLMPHCQLFTEIGVASRSALPRLGGTMFALFLRVPFRELSDEDLAPYDS